VGFGTACRLGLPLFFGLRLAMLIACRYLTPCTTLASPFYCIWDFCRAPQGGLLLFLSASSPTLFSGRRHGITPLPAFASLAPILPISANLCSTRRWPYLVLIARRGARPPARGCKRLSAVGSASTLASDLLLSPLSEARVRPVGQYLRCGVGSCGLQPRCSLFWVAALDCLESHSPHV